MRLISRKYLRTFSLKRKIRRSYKKKKSVLNTAAEWFLQLLISSLKSFMYRIWQPMTLRSQTIFFGEQRLFFRTAVATSSRCGTIFLFHVSDECFNVHALLSFSSGHLNFYKSRWSLNAISCTFRQNVDLLWDYQLYKI